jgi:hypothetical protein
VHRAHARAAETGGAHHIVAGPRDGRGGFLIYEALDNIAGPTPPGPNPASSCKTGGQWAQVPGYTGTPSNLVRFVEALNLDTLGVNVDANVVAAFRVTAPTTPDTLASTGALAICVTGNGTTYAAGGTDIQDAINNMMLASPFTGVAEIDISRSGGIGLVRSVMVAGGASPRVISR